MKQLIAVLLVIVSWGVPTGAMAAEKNNNGGKLPPFFTYLRAVDDSILQEMRYYGVHNFLGRRVKGYEAAECILTKRAANALAKVQTRLKARGLSLKVYDCYRPQRAVKDFVRWSQNKDKKTKPEFYPTLKKTRLFGLGYIARRSTHSRGSTVDLTIVPLPAEKQPKYSFDKQVACFEAAESRYLDNSLDFGTGYDCFHELSHTKNPNISEVARRNRALLVNEMARVGFDNYSKEWWHFTLKNEPYKRRHFDFPILPYRDVKSEAVDQGMPGEMGKANKENKEIKTQKEVQEDSALAAGETEPDEGAVPVDDLPDLIGGPAVLRVVCVTGDDVLNVRDGPGAGGELVGTLAPDAGGIKSSGCTGSVPLGNWHGLTAQKRSLAGTPWCLISEYQPGEGAAPLTMQGWVSGAFVVPEGAKPRACPGR